MHLFSAMYYINSHGSLQILGIIENLALGPTTPGRQVHCININVKVYYVEIIGPVHAKKCSPW